MKQHRTSTRRIKVESYVTQRSEWPPELARRVETLFVARGHRVVDGVMEWQYFDTVQAANAWAGAVHRQPNNEVTNAHHD